MTVVEETTCRNTNNDAPNLCSEENGKDILKKFFHSQDIVHSSFKDIIFLQFQ